ncbi:hypothetical protein ANCCAN_03015 [Ancylostoma caninum]|uniref:Uncharacterized protein n=1 Tax=Ancylostoma caninum TaxID=29170 RepID=A0A368H2K6_ANCCA|nr:hypothetical protein ANCCAN_03015 [Ancylostoma caninum]
MRCRSRFVVGLYLHNTVRTKSCDWTRIGRRRKPAQTKCDFHRKSLAKVM